MTEFTSPYDINHCWQVLFYTPLSILRELSWKQMDWQSKFEDRQNKQWPQFGFFTPKLIAGKQLTSLRTLSFFFKSSERQRLEHLLVKHIILYFLKLEKGKIWWSIFVCNRKHMATKIIACNLKRQVLDTNEVNNMMFISIQTEGICINVSFIRVARMVLKKY